MHNKYFITIAFILSFTTAVLAKQDSVSSIQLELKKAEELIQKNKQKSAFELLMKKEGDVKKESDPILVAKFYMKLGDLSILLGRYPQAFTYFDTANLKAKESKNSALISASNNNLGNIYEFTGHAKKAKAYYEKALIHAEGKTERLSIRLNALKASSFIDKDEKFIKEYTLLLNTLLELKDDKEWIKSSVNFFAFSANLFERRFFPAEEEKKLIVDALKIGDKIVNSKTFVSHRHSASIVYGAFAKIYLLKNKPQQAQELFYKAVFFAQTPTLQADLSYYWKYRIAKIYKENGELDKAMKMYAESLSILEPIKQQLYYGFRDINDRFNKDIVPVYRDLMELHLIKAESTKDKNKRDEHLKAIIKLYAKLKTSELQFFFLNACISSSNGSKIAIPKDTMIIYPIVLQNQFVVITRSSEGYSYKQTYMSADEMYSLTQSYRYQLQVSTNSRFIHYSHALYDMIIAPFEDDFKKKKISNLVFSPQGFMGLIPYSTLMKDKKFLIEEYAVTQITTMDTTKFRDRPKQPNALILGLSAARHHMSALPNVANEVKSVSARFKKSTILLNKDYTFDNVQSHLEAAKTTNLHFATHGVFDPDPTSSFLSAYDHPIMLPNLKSLLDTNSNNKSDGYDLITLSACQSSIGNEKALLGLAGVGLQAGASTVMATLWYVDDEATKIMIDTFYEEIEARTSKGHSLQIAQKKLIHSKRYWHPIYWSPFVMIGDWR